MEFSIDNENNVTLPSGEKVHIENLISAYQMRKQETNHVKSMVAAMVMPQMIKNSLTDPKRAAIEAVKYANALIIELGK